MNKWGIPDWLEEKVKKKYRFCVYCHVKLKKHQYTIGTHKDKATLEHIDNYGPNSESNVVMCCSSCNSSKGTKKLIDWLKSSYCKRNGINEKTIAKVVKSHIKSKIS